jgi:hypothetical protein
VQDFCPQSRQTALKEGSATLVSMTTEKLHSAHLQEDKDYDVIAQSLYLVETGMLVQILYNSDEATNMYHRIKEEQLLINKDKVILREFSMMYPKYTRKRIIDGDELTQNDRAFMITQCIQRMYQANASEVGNLVRISNNLETKRMGNEYGALRMWMHTRRIVQSYLHPRVFRLKEEELINENKTIIKIYGMSGSSSSLSVSLKRVEHNGIYTRNDDSVVELLLAPEYSKKQD